MTKRNQPTKRELERKFARELRTGAVDLSQVAASPKTITLAYVAGENVRTAWHRSILAVAARSPQFGFQVRPRDCESGPFLSRARNLLLKSFLETEDEYLLFTDTDIAFAPQDVAMLLAADAAIAGALYFSAALGVEPWPTALVEESPDPEAEASPKPRYVPVTLPKPPEDFDQDDSEQVEAWLGTLALPIPVAGVGMGLTLIKREVAVRMAANFEHPFEYEGDRGEDLVFCLRAAELGYETIVMPAARVGHMKVTML